MALYGTLEDIHIVDLIQFPKNGRKTGELRIAGPDAEAHLFYDEGQLRHAQLGAREGLDALVECIEWTHGDFEFRDGASAARETLHQDLHHTLMQALKLRDERRGGRDAPPKPAPTLGPSPPRATIGGPRVEAAARRPRSPVSSPPPRPTTPRETPTAPTQRARRTTNPHLGMAVAARGGPASTPESGERPETRAGAPASRSSRPDAPARPPSRPKVTSREVVSSETTPRGTSPPPRDHDGPAKAAGEGPSRHAVALPPPRPDAGLHEALSTLLGARPALASARVLAADGAALADTAGGELGASRALDTSVMGLVRSWPGGRPTRVLVAGEAGLTAVAVLGDGRVLIARGAEGASWGAVSVGLGRLTVGLEEGAAS